MRLLVMRLSNVMSVVAGMVLVAMVLITFADIVMRYMGKPIPGVYEIIAYLGVAVIGFGLPRASMKKTHVYVDLVIDKLSIKQKMVLRIFTRIMVFLFFALTGWYFIGMGKAFVATHSVTMTLRVPFYPVVFGMVLSCCAQCAVSIVEIVEEYGGSTNE